MRLTVIGSGTAAPHPTRVASGHWVAAGAARILFDCGNGVVHRMAGLGIDWASVTHVAITHFHYDHVGDIPALIAALQWGQDVPRSTPLVLVGPPGTAAWFDRVAAAAGDWVRNPGGFDVTVRELAPLESFEPVPGDGARLTSCRVPHTDESVAYSLSRLRARFVYTGDTSDDDAVANWAAECDVLLTECSLPAARAMAGHLTPETVGAFAARVRPRRLVLTHFYPPVEREDITSLVRSRWTGPLVLAQDGTVVDIEE